MADQKNIFELIKNNFDEEYLAIDYTKNDSEESQTLCQREKFAELFISLMKKTYRFNIVKWVPNKKEYPQYMLLGTDKGILAYINFYFHDSKSMIIEEEISYQNICYELNDLVKQVGLVYSDLDRPTFNLHLIDYPDVKDILYETTEQLQDGLLKEQLHIADLDRCKYVFTPIHEMGTVEELIKTFQDLKKYNVKVN